LDKFDLVRELFLPFIIGLASSATVVAIGVKSVKAYIRDIERKRSIGDLVHFWSGPGKSRQFNIVFGADWAGREGEIEPRFGYAQAYGISELISCLELIFQSDVTVKPIWIRSTARLEKQFFDENIIILGGQLSIEAFGRFSRRIAVPYYQYQLDPSNREFEEHTTKERIPSDIKDKRLVADVGTVTRLLNPANRNLIVLYNGNYGAGLLGAILSTTKKDNFHRTGFSSTCEAQQLVIRVADILDNIIDRDHTVQPVRNWKEFHVKDEQIDAAIIDKDTVV
jgi:hypothetical protein